jgi:hypothetical protein
LHLQEIAAPRQEGRKTLLYTDEYLDYANGIISRRGCRFFLAEQQRRQVKKDKQHCTGFF